MARRHCHLLSVPQPQSLPQLPQLPQLLLLPLCRAKSRDAAAAAAAVSATAVGNPVLVYGWVVCCSVGNARHLLQCGNLHARRRAIGNSICICRYWAFLLARYLFLFAVWFGRAATDCVHHPKTANDRQLAAWHLPAGRQRKNVNCCAR